MNKMNSKTKQDVLPLSARKISIIHNFNFMAIFEINCSPNEEFDFNYLSDDRGIYVDHCVVLNKQKFRIRNFDDLTIICTKIHSNILKKSFFRIYILGNFELRYDNPVFEKHQGINISTEKFPSQELFSHCIGFFNWIFTTNKMKLYHGELFYDYSDVQLNYIVSYLPLYEKINAYNFSIERSKCYGSILFPLILINNFDYKFPKEYLFSFIKSAFHDFEGTIKLLTIMDSKLLDFINDWNNLLIIQKYLFNYCDINTNIIIELDIELNENNSKFFDKYYQEQLTIEYYNDETIEEYPWDLEDFYASYRGNLGLGKKEILIDKSSIIKFSESLKSKYSLLCQQFDYNIRI